MLKTWGAPGTCRPQLQGQPSPNMLSVRLPKSEMPPGWCTPKPKVDVVPVLRLAVAGTPASDRSARNASEAADPTLRKGRRAGAEIAGVSLDFVPLQSEKPGKHEACPNSLECGRTLRLKAKPRSPSSRPYSIPQTLDPLPFLHPQLTAQQPTNPAQKVGFFWKPLETCHCAAPNKATSRLSKLRSTMDALKANFSQSYAVLKPQLELKQHTPLNLKSQTLNHCI